MLRKPQQERSVPEAAAEGWQQGKKGASRGGGRETFLVGKVLSAGCCEERECLQCMVLHLDEEKMIKSACSSLQKNGQ